MANYVYNKRKMEKKKQEIEKTREPVLVNCNM